MRGGRVLDALANCSAVAFDKTGTLTTGVLAPVAVMPLNTSGQAPPPHGLPLGTCKALQSAGEAAMLQL